MNIRDTVRHHRDSQAWTQEDLGDRLFTTRQIVSNWEIGSSNVPIEYMIRMCELFNISPNEFLSWSEKNERQDDAQCIHKMY